MRASILYSFADLGEDEYVTLIQRIAPAAKNNPHFPEPWPQYVLSPDQLIEAVKNYVELYRGAKKGDRDVIASRTEARTNLSGELRKLAHFYEMVADGSLEALTSTQFPLRRDAAKKAVHEAPAAPKHVKATRGSVSSTAIVHAPALEDVLFYELDITTGDPMVEANWARYGRFEHCNRIELSGLTPLKTYCTRLRGVNGVGEGPWTMSSPLVVL